MRRWLSHLALPCLLACAGQVYAAPETHRVLHADWRYQQVILQMADGPPIVLSGIVLPQAPNTLQAMAGRDVVLQQKQDLDRYGRLPAAVRDVGDRQTWQEHLIAAGEAVVYSPSALPQAAKWLALEHMAEVAQRGIWAQAGGVRITPEQAQHKLQQFALVRGRVTRTHMTRDTYYINFGDNWKTDFSLMIPRAAWRGFGDHLEVAEGTELRARGTLISENGPMLVITRPEQLEK